MHGETNLDATSHLWFPKPFSLFIVSSLHLCFGTFHFGKINTKDDNDSNDDSDSAHNNSNNDRNDNDDKHNNFVCKKYFKNLLHKYWYQLKIL